MESARLDAERLLARALGLSRIELYTQHDRPLSEAERAAARELVQRRGAREPLAYVLGDWDFRRLTLRTDARALVPRPETEIVVERCLALIRDQEAPCVLDVGTGSGAIALAIAHEHRGARVAATDASESALELARENARANELDVVFVSHRSARGHRRAVRPRRLQPAVCRAGRARRARTGGARLGASPGSGRRGADQSACSSTPCGCRWVARARGARAARVGRRGAADKPWVPGASASHRTLPARIASWRHGGSSRGDRCPCTGANPALLPTDTVYGLAAVALTRVGGRPGLYRLKGRVDRQPVALLAANVEQLFACLPGAAGGAALSCERFCRAGSRSCSRIPARRYAWLTGVATRRDRGAGAQLFRARRPRVVEAVGCVAATSANDPGGP